VREVTFCERSTITEAWAVVLGRPVPVILEEPAAIVMAAKRALPQLEREPAMVIAEIPQRGPVAPFWSQQWAWDEGRLRARIGHRYLGVHRLADEEHRYETYERSLAPALRSWLEACVRVYDDPLIIQALDQVGYGYINTFSFPAADFDLTKIVRMELGIELAGLHDGLDGFDVKLHYRDKLQPTARVAVQVIVQPDGPVPETLLVRTKVTAAVAQEGSWTDRAFVERQVLVAKAAAKRAFFDLVTDETREMMGAQYGNPT
jgi:hypothetical protein